MEKNMLAPKHALLCLLLLLWPCGHASWREEEEEEEEEEGGGGGGEWCGIWPPGKAAPVGGYQCPQPHDAAQAKFCCGTCLLPFCCSSGEARRDQERCAHLVPWKTSFTSPPRTPRPVARKIFGAWKTLGAIVIPASTFGLLLTLFCWCKGRSNCQHSHRQYRVVFDHRSLDWMQWVGVHPPSPAHTMGPPPPYTEDPPPCSAENYPPHWDSPPPSPVGQMRHVNGRHLEEEIMLRPLVHRNVPGQASEAATEVEMSADL